MGNVGERMKQNYERRKACRRKVTDDRKKSFLPFRLLKSMNIGNNAYTQWESAHAQTSLLQMYTICVFVIATYVYA